VGSIIVVCRSFGEYLSFSILKKMLDLLNQMLSSMINSIVTSLQPKLQPLLGAYESVALLNFPGMTPAARFGLCIMGQVITTAITVRERQGDKKYYWLHSLLLVILNGFGGGIVAFMMIGLPPIIASNDLIIPLCVLFWYLTHYLGMCPVLSFPPIKVLLFSTHSTHEISPTDLMRMFSIRSYGPCSPCSLEPTLYVI
jgi:hypothetical protein